MDTVCYFHIWLSSNDSWSCKRYNDLGRFLIQTSLRYSSEISKIVDDLRNIGIPFSGLHPPFMEVDFYRLFLAVDRYLKGISGGNHSYFLSEPKARQIVEGDIFLFDNCVSLDNLICYLKAEGFCDLQKCLQKCLKRCLCPNCCE